MAIAAVVAEPATEEATPLMEPCRVHVAATIESSSIQSAIA